MNSANRFALGVWMLLLIVALSFFSSCDQKPRTLGSVDRVITLADSTLWLQIEPLVRSAVERDKFTPQPEKMLNVVVQPPSAIGNLKRYPHILFISTLDSKGADKQIVDQLLTPAARERVEQDSSFLFQKKDAWSRGQLLVAVIGRDLETLKSRLATNGEVIFNIINGHANSIVQQSLYSSHEQFDIEKQILDSQGYQIRVQHDYIVAVDSAAARFLWLRRLGSLGDQRNLAVYWEPCEDPSMLSREWMIANRNRLAADHFGGDIIYEDEQIRIAEQDVEFNELYAIRLDGVWLNEQYSVGGPFRTYGFFSPHDNRLYLIDLSVLRPGERKWLFMRQLDQMANTFKTAAQLVK